MEFSFTDYFKKLSEEEQAHHASNVLILCGLPGAGKTHYINNLFEEEDKVVVSRDEIRSNLIWDLRKNPQNITINLDNKVDLFEMDAVEKELKKRLHKWIVLDGCHCKLGFLRNIIALIHLVSPCSDVVLVFIGNEKTKCSHFLTDKKDGDYSDYEKNGTHFSIPLEVYKRKQKEMREIFDNFNSIREICDIIHFLPSYIDFLSEDELKELKESQKNK